MGDQWRWGALVSIPTGGLKILGQGRDRIYRPLRNHKEFSVIVDVGKHDSVVQQIFIVGLCPYCSVCTEVHW